MKIAILDGNMKDTPSGGTITYITKYFFPALMTDPTNDLYILTWDGSGSSAVRNYALENNISIVDLTPSSMSSYKEFINSLDAVFTSDVMPVWNKDKAHSFYEEFKKVDTKLIATVHTTMDSLVKNKHINHEDNLLTHPNLFSAIIYRPSYYDLIMGKYKDVHNPSYKFNDRNDYIVHKPYVGYLDTTNLVDWKDRDNAIGFMGRTSPDKKYYMFMRGVNQGLAESFDKYIYATDESAMWYWDRVKYDQEFEKMTDEQKSKWEFIPKYVPDDVPSISNKLRFVSIPTMKPDIVFPGEWVGQEAMYTGVIPICTDNISIGLPEELSFLKDFSHKASTRVTPNYDEIVSKYSEDELSEFSERLIKYSHENWGSLESSRDHLYGVISGKKQFDLQ